MVSCDLSSSGLNTSPGQQLHPGKHNGLHIPPCSEGLGSCRPLNAQLHPSNSTYLLQSANTTRWADSLALWHSCSSTLPRAGHRQPMSSTLKYIWALIHDHTKNSQLSSLPPNSLRSAQVRFSITCPTLDLQAIPVYSPAYFILLCALKKHAVLRPTYRYHLPLRCSFPHLAF